MEEDNYIVDVTLSLRTVGHGDPEFPDKRATINFNATDVHVDVVLQQFEDFLVLMGYYMDKKKLALVPRD